MDTLNHKTLKQMAGERLRNGNPGGKKLALYHSGTAVGAALLVSLLQYLLGNQITGGLSGLGMRSVLETAQAVLQYVLNIALPFWEIGFLFVALKFARQERAVPRDLLQGFRRFGAVLRLYLVESMFLSAAMMACMYTGSFLFMMLPLSTPMMEMLLPMVESGASMEQVQEAMYAMPVEELLEMMLPMLIIGGVLFVGVAVFLFYRFRLAHFVLMDHENMGAFRALIFSNRLARGYRMKLVKLDLSFWWFYALQLLAAVVLYADVLLQYIVVDVALTADAMWFISYLAGSLLQVLIFWQWNAKVQTTYALAYDTIRNAPVQMPRPQPVPAPQNLPWDDSYEKAKEE